MTLRRRHLSARILLAVFLPMLLLSSLHVHTPAHTPKLDEAQCAHQHCYGHLAPQPLGQQHCLLCQFLDTPVVAAKQLLVEPTQTHRLAQDITSASHNTGHHAAGLHLRAPPAA
ncbi:MAG: hypothetical protein SPL64_02090 [Bacteroidaceae bacterium]|nr:hypothetical protein [Bacteroidaceae bacterium]